MFDLLAGTRVVELAQWVMVPSSAALLADLGADVIKIEHPVHGDPYRGIRTAALRDSGAGESPAVAHTNRGKRSLGLDVKRPAGRALLAELLEGADVLLTSLRVPAMERLNLAPDTIHAINPRLVYARANAFGYEELRARPQPRGRGGEAAPRLGRRPASHRGSDRTLVRAARLPHRHHLGANAGPAVMTAEFIPPVSDADSAPFWAAVREHRLTVQRCAECQAYRFPPRPICPRCRSWSFAWSEVSGQGRVLSWLVAHHVTHPAFACQLPYPILFVELAEQPGLMRYGNLRPPGAPIVSGMPVRAVYEDLSDTVTLVQWVPA